MKKSLLLGMVLGLGLMSVASAANPFSDVPSDHWAYAAVNELVQKGVIEGYEGAYNGDRLASRYEMAQIVAKALAKGIECSALESEFAQELDSLGVRVSRAEKKIDNVKITGNIRYSYRDNVGGMDEKLTGRAGKGYNRFRSRIFVKGTINDDWQYTGMLENDRYLDAEAKNSDEVKLKRAFVNGRLGGIKLEGGRIYCLQEDMFDGEADGVKAAYDYKGLKLSGWAAKNANYKIPSFGDEEVVMEADRDRFYMAKIEKSFGKLDVFAQYWKMTLAEEDSNSDVFEAGIAYPVMKNMQLTAKYYHGNNDGEQDVATALGYEVESNGYELGLSYKGAKAAKPGSWGLWAKYSDRPAVTYYKPSAMYTYGFNDLDSGWLLYDGYKGFEFGANWTVAKNIVATVRYFDFKSREKLADEDLKIRTLWSDVTFLF